MDVSDARTVPVPHLGTQILAVDVLGYFRQL